MAVEGMYRAILVILLEQVTRKGLLRSSIAPVAKWRRMHSGYIRGGCYAFKNNCEDFAIYCKTGTRGFWTREQLNQGTKPHQSSAVLFTTNIYGMAASAVVVYYISDTSVDHVTRRVAKAFIDATLILGLLTSHEIQNNVVNKKVRGKDAVKVSVEELTRRLLAGGSSELTSTSETPAPAHDGPRPQPSAPPLPADAFPVEPVTGYPPVMGYPNHNRTHIQPPPLTIPPPRQRPSPRRPHVSRRCAIVTLIAIIVVLSMVSAVVRRLYRTRAPVVTVVGLSVSNYSTSGTALTADWEVNITIGNPSPRMKATFERVPICVYYRNMYMTCGETDPFELGAKGKTSLSLNVTAERKALWLEQYMISEMEMDRESGEMSFDIRMGMSVTYRHRLWWPSHNGLRVSCSGITVRFGSGSVGNTVYGDQECLVS
ncbi:hypothetical protein MLD38_033129 [Melastoma candidum]|uniref:Uncharacterized protein n=1 Tax=Melastoma candidum TaxID=119954 RepID=A0ACB9M5L0_9MYRT|nr:hypothetical protein MLD38_033129 [Melastoma candidum]